MSMLSMRSFTSLEGVATTRRVKRTVLLVLVVPGLLTGSALANSDVYGESVTSKWGQLFAIDVLYATYATRYYEETEHNLQESYLSGIRSTRGESAR